MWWCLIKNKSDFDNFAQQEYQQIIIINKQIYYVQVGLFSEESGRGPYKINA
jgi:hypothetical protein